VPTYKGGEEEAGGKGGEKERERPPKVGSHPHIPNPKKYPGHWPASS